MRTTWKTAALLLALLATGPLLAAEKDSKFFFKKGERIVFLGDSITEQYQYSTYMELYLTTRFPKWDLTFINAGIGGDTAWGGAPRFAAHVLAEKPTAVTIDFGMNDGGYGKLDQNRLNMYVKNTRAMLEAAKKADVRVALISPNVVDWRVRPNLTLYRDTQKKFYAPLKDIAADFKVPFVDQYAVTRAVIEKLEQEMAKQVNPFPDGVHTSGQGGLLMAHTILVGLHAPALVSDVEIDVATGKALTKACTVAKLEIAENKVIGFDRTDEAIPMPLAKDWLPILPYVNQLKDLNWYGLKVKGLATGKYTVLIDGKDVGTFSAEQLAEGVNLGNLITGPIYDQGKKVFDAINAKNGIVHGRFRGVVMFNAPDWLADVAAERKPKELAKRMKLIEERQAAIYKMVTPVKHHFEVKPAK
jgi:lysophospholipase L1-like esterase